MLKKGIVLDWRYIDHRPGDFHPESPKRLETIYEMHNDEETVKQHSHVPDGAAKLEELTHFMIYQLRFKIVIANIHFELFIFT